MCGWLQASHPKHKTSCLKCGHGNREDGVSYGHQVLYKKTKGAMIRPNAGH